MLLFHQLLEKVRTDWSGIKIANPLAEEFPKPHMSTVVTKSLVGFRGRVSDFVTWIGEEKDSEPLPYGAAHIIVNSLPSPWPTSDWLPLIKLPCTVLTPDGVRYSADQGFIRFQVTKRREMVHGDEGGTLFHVEAQCHEPAVRPHFDYLIDEILRDWPGVKVKDAGQGTTAVPHPTSPQPNAESENASPSPAMIDFRNDLCNKMQHRFDMNDLRNLCATLGMDHEEFDQSSKSAFIRGFVQYCIQRERLPQLVAQLRMERPEEDWPDPPLS